jgi:methylthioribose-1-phosphate isomerase
MIDQRALPGRLSYIKCHTSREIIRAIQNMCIRGAPAIGIAGAYAFALAAIQSKARQIRALKSQITKDAIDIQAARPTAINLRWAVERMKRIVETGDPTVDSLPQMLLEEANRMADEDVAINRRMAEHGAKLIRDGDTIIHHCNTGSLATVEWGTALGCIRMAHEQGKKVHVLVDETRPRLQGSRLTAWELEQYGIPYEIIVDGASGYYLEKRKAHLVMFGADRVAANGDVANKVGSYMLALAANDNRIPVYSVAPISSFDMTIKNGDVIPIEERDQDEVLGLSFHGKRVAPREAKARNPAFDITPNRLISSFVTENGVVRPPYKKNLSFIMDEKFQENVK